MTDTNEFTETEKLVLRLFLSADATAVDTVFSKDLPLRDGQLDAFQDFEGRGLVRRINKNEWGLTLEGLTMAAKLMRPWRKTVFVTETIRLDEVAHGVDEFTLATIRAMIEAAPMEASKLVIAKLSDGSVAMKLPPATPAKQPLSFTKTPCDPEAAFKLRKAELERAVLDLKITELREKIERRPGE